MPGKLPDDIAEYLKSDFEKRRRPFCFMIDSEYRLQDWWGDAESHGFGRLRAGENMLDRAPYLFGHLGTATEVLPFVATARDHTVEMHVMPGKARFQVVLIDASLEHDIQQQRQQTANEVRLLHLSQQNLIGRQRSLISELIEAKAELDHRRREAELNSANKSQFVAMMSHEFRTPLSSIINYADLALEEGTSVGDVRRSAEAIARASRHMHRLVDTVLDDAHLEAGQLKATERTFAVPALFDDLGAIMAPLAAEKALAFAIYLTEGVPDYLCADDVSLRQVFINLIGNAIKFTDAGGVRLDVDWKSDWLKVIVTDSGPGIDLVDQKRIFGAFERGDEAGNREIPGSGLGLTITLKLVRLMRGQVDLESEPGAGCKVRVLIPANVVEQAAGTESAFPEPVEELHAVRPATILLCDDDEDLLALAEHYLHRAGYGLLVARDGEEAVSKALDCNPDLILMDINTPGLSGSEAASRLRKAGFSAPIVALTASDVRKLDNEDFTGTLRKPIQMPRLLAQVQSHIR